MAVLAGAYEAVPPPRRPATSPPRAPGCSCGSSASRRASPAREPTRRWRSGRSRAGTTTPEAALAAVRADLLDTYQARLNASLEAADQAVERGFAIAGGERGDAGGRIRRHPRAGLPRAARSGRSGRPRRGCAGACRRCARGRRDRLRRGARLARRGARRFPRRTAVRRGGGAPGGPVPPLPRARAGRVRPRGRRRPGDARLRGAGGDHVPGRRRPGLRRSRSRAGQARRGRDGAHRRRRRRARQRARARRPRRAGGRSRARARRWRRRRSTLADGIFPEAWKDTEAADFDVIRTSLDRVEGAVAAGEWGKAEQARLEAYAFFEFGPEQRLRGLAPELFISVEGLFWYGEGDHAGPGAAPHAEVGAGGGEGDASRSRRGARRRGGRGRLRAAVDVLRRHQHRDHRLPGGPRGGADPGGADRGHGRRAAALPPAAPARRGRGPRRVGRDVRRGADGARLADALRREARGSGLARRDRGAAR